MCHFVLKTFLYCSGRSNSNDNTKEEMTDDNHQPAKIQVL